MHILDVKKIFKELTVQLSDYGTVTIDQELKKSQTFLVLYALLLVGKHLVVT